MNDRDRRQVLCVKCILIPETLHPYANQTALAHPASLISPGAPA